MVALAELVAYADDLLEVGLFQDYCPNGLQVEGRNVVRRLAAGVTASQRLVDAAAARAADILLVHHGYFWKGEDPCVTGMKRRRLAALIRADVSLLAYHLPLDAHREFGNNAQLAQVLGFVAEGRFGPGPGPKIGWFGRLAAPLSATELAARIAHRLARAPLHLGGESGFIRRVGWCTGAAQSYLEQAADLGLDAFVSGEVSEQTTHVVRERGIHFFAAGHHATERYGVQALGRHLAERFGLDYEFIDIDNPV